MIQILDIMIINALEMMVTIEELHMVTIAIETETIVKEIEIETETEGALTVKDGKIATF